MRSSTGSSAPSSPESSSMTTLYLRLPDAARIPSASISAKEFYRIYGVDLTAIPGVDIHTVYTLFAECGRNLSAFSTAAEFARWLGLCPDNRITGGKVLSTRTRKVNHPLATAFRLAAQTLHRSQSALGDFYRRMRYRLAPAKAITAVAHKLARIIYRLVTTGQAYDETVLAHNDQNSLARKTRRLTAHAPTLGYTLVPAKPSSPLALREDEEEDEALSAAVAFGLVHLSRR